MATHLQLREALGRELDDLSYYVAASGGANAVAIAALISGTTNPSPSHMNGMWVFNATKRLQRRTRTNSFVASTGTISLDPAWTSPAANDRIEFTSIFPSVEQVQVSEVAYQTIINRSLQQYLVPRRITLTIVPGATSYDLTTWYRWLNREERLGWPNLPDGTPQPRMLEPGPTGGLPIPGDWRRPRINLNGASQALNIEAPFAAGTTGVITLNVMSPANTWVGLSGAAYTESTVNEGVVDDADLVVPSVADLMPIMLAEVCEILGRRGKRTANGRWGGAEAAEQRARAERLFYYDRTSMLPPIAAGAAA